MIQTARPAASRYKRTKFVCPHDSSFFCTVSPFGQDLKTILDREDNEMMIGMIRR